MAILDPTLLSRRGSAVDPAKGSSEQAASVQRGKSASSMPSLDTGGANLLLIIKVNAYTLNFGLVVLCIIIFS